MVYMFLYLFGVLRRFQHCTGHITTGSWKGRGNQYIEFVRVLYCKLPTNGKQLPAFPLEAGPGIEPRPQRWEARVLPLCHRGPGIYVSNFITIEDNSIHPWSKGWRLCVLSFQVTNILLLTCLLCPLPVAAVYNLANKVFHYQPYDGFRSRYYLSMCCILTSSCLITKFIQHWTWFVFVWVTI